ncbi:hypothetical protein WA026_016593 [Henosepilachna vigintioctopunctata]|uniref:Uncharacterized protein n=1 Tax=Henosepilachna vigintioctopunctata TaxID=420089 RepID=A0AAW1VHQ5_9CUCU
MLPKIIKNQTSSEEGTMPKLKIMIKGNQTIKMSNKKKISKEAANNSNSEEKSAESNQIAHGMESGPDRDQNEI